VSKAELRGDSVPGSREAEGENSEDFDLPERGDTPIYS